MRTSPEHAATSPATPPAATPTTDESIGTPGLTPPPGALCGFWAGGETDLLAPGTDESDSEGDTESVAAGAGIVGLARGVGSIAAGDAVGAWVDTGFGGAVTAAVRRGVGFGVGRGVGWAVGSGLLNGALVGGATTEPGPPLLNRQS